MSTLILDTMPEAPTSELLQAFREDAARKLAYLQTRFDQEHGTAELTEKRAAAIHRIRRALTVIDLGLDELFEGLVDSENAV